MLAKLGKAAGQGAVVFDQDGIELTLLRLLFQLLLQSVRLSQPLSLFTGFHELLDVTHQHKSSKNYH